jgi:hypothetical protein
MPISTSQTFHILHGFARVSMGSVPRSVPRQALWRASAFRPAFRPRSR